MMNTKLLLSVFSFCVVLDVNNHKEIKILSQDLTDRLVAFNCTTPTCFSWLGREFVVCSSAVASKKGRLNWIISISLSTAHSSKATVLWTSPHAANCREALSEMALQTTSRSWPYFWVAQSPVAWKILLFLLMTSVQASVTYCCLSVPILTLS